MANEKKDEESKTALSLKELPYQVREFWKATGVPLVELTICIVIVSWCVTGIGLRSIANHFETQVGVSSNMQVTSNSSDAKNLPTNHTKEGGDNVLETYGISAILPLATIVVLLGIAQGISAFVRMMGSSLKIHAMYKINLLLLRYLPVDLLIETWSHFESASDVTDLSQKLDQEVTRSESNNSAKRFFERSRQFKPVIEQLEGSRRFIAGLIFIGIVILVFETIKGPSIEQSIIKVVQFFSVGSVVLAYVNLSFLRTTRLYHHRKFSDFVAWKAYEDKLSGKGNSAENDPSRETVLYKIKNEMESIENSNERLFCLVSGTEDLEFDIFSRTNHNNNYNQILSHINELNRK